MRIETEYRTYENVFLRVERYMADSSLCILLYNRDYAVIAKLTTCLDDKNLKDNESYIDTNNCPWAIDFIREYKLGELTGKKRVSGYCTYPVVKFDMDEIQKYVKHSRATID